ncbi:putative membrane protein [Asticcacaulis biprosthecium C19]|uniref:Putative membrane protein n=1 Tax=Asticcacaulis biprosthecium C19 TaxID=715226 RepID=F4QSQ1_9CAUL|nr:hypothetical protein [Asticcacaulis biprosthecium]EGF89771.1 putative membrane protein [Asticcacaulis biprosthecium C19]
MRNINLLWAAAAVMMAGIAVLHVTAGGMQYVPPLLAQTGLNANETGIYYYVWHMATLTMAVVAMVYAGAAWQPAWKGPAMLVNGLTLSFAALSVTIGMRFGQFPWDLPQWVLFLAVGVTGIAAGFQRQAR